MSVILHSSDISDRSVAWATVDNTNLSVADLHFRSERQTLRRLPKSKAVLFLVRTYFEPITIIAQEPFIPGRLADAVRNWDDTMASYKGRRHWQGVLLPYLDEQDRKQKEAGMLDKLEESQYPF